LRCAPSHAALETFDSLARLHSANYNQFKPIRYSVAAGHPSS